MTDTKAPEMVERVALEIREEWKLYGFPHAPSKQLATALAEAAIRAMRRPTSAMLASAGGDSFFDDTASPLRCWEAMIDASLSQTEG